jgi:hypothetical protein
MGSRTRNGDNSKQSKTAAHLTTVAETTHDRMRDQLARDVEAFLAKGGVIQHLDPHMRSGIDTDSDQDSY